MIFAVLALACAALVATPSACAASAAGCGQGQIRVATGCATDAAAGRHIAAMIREEMPKLGLRAVLIRIDTGETPLINQGFGNSMKGVPPRRRCTSGSARSRSPT